MAEWYDKILEGDFTAFIGRVLHTVDPGATYIPNKHIEMVAEYLEAIRRGHITRLIINMPPRSLKSIAVSVAWPAWLLGHNPKSRIIVSSYASALSLKHSLDTRHVITSSWYKELFPKVRLTKDQNEKHKFQTTQRGYRIASSVGGGITGEGGNFLIIDDPINPAHAMNKHWREHTNSWFDHTFASRLDDKKQGAIVLVMQRLHQNDMTGYLLSKGGWEHLSLPAIFSSTTTYSCGSKKWTFEEGELLHPKREDQKLIERAKIELGSRAFSAQYMQNPLGDEDGLVRSHWIERYNIAPAHFEKITQSWDTAIKSSEASDRSVCLTFGELSGKCYLLDAKAYRYEYPDLKRTFYAMASHWQPQVILVEDKSSGQQLIQDAKRETTIPVIPTRPQKDKITRFSAVSALIEAGRLVLPMQAQWLADFEAELFGFPNARHDDFVDALSQYLDWVRRSSWNKLRIRSI